MWGMIFWGGGEAVFYTYCGWSLVGFSRWSHKVSLEFAFAQEKWPQKAAGFPKEESVKGRTTNQQKT